MKKSQIGKLFEKYESRRTAANLPGEIIMEILPRVPAETLGRCKCVSKQWGNLISDLKFIKTHLSLNNRRAKGLLVDQGSLFVADFDGNRTYGCEERFATQLKVKPPVSYSFGAVPKWEKVYCSYNGLVLLKDSNLRFFLLNPVTLECKKLPEPPGVRFAYEDELLGFGYDSTTDDYKAVVISYPNKVCVYSFKTNDWERLQNSPFDYGEAGSHNEEGVFLNGSLHWFGETSSDSYKSSSISAFDLVDETFRVVPLPSKFDGFYDRVLSRLGVVGGSLCIVCQENGWHVHGRIDVWVMNEYGVEESWSKLSFYQSIADVNPVFFLGNDEFIVISGKTEAVIYNVKEQSSRHIVFLGLQHPLPASMQSTFLDSLVSYKQLLSATYFQT